MKLKTIDLTDCEYVYRIINGKTIAIRKAIKKQRRIKKRYCLLSPILDLPEL
jgi:hypothetical protein